MRDERLIAALERIAVALEPKPPMGFHEPTHSAKRVYIANEGEYLWYFWDGEKQLPIWENEFTGKLLELSTQEKEFKRKTNSKLLLTFEGEGGRLYTFQTGLNTMFARCILLSLVQLAKPRGSILTLVPRHGEQNTVFCSVFCEGKRIEYEWDGETDPSVFLVRLMLTRLPEKPAQLSQKELLGLVASEREQLGWSPSDIKSYASDLLERDLDNAYDLSVEELQRLLEALRQEVVDDGNG